MATYSVFVMDFLVLEAENEEDAVAQAKTWFREMMENDDITWDVEEGDATEDMDDDEEDDDEDEDD
jgi:hypothetical protein